MTPLEILMGGANLVDHRLCRVFLGFEVLLITDQIGRLDLRNGFMAIVSQPARREIRLPVVLVVQFPRLNCAGDGRGGGVGE